jgi:hypothetical protein
MNGAQIERMLSLIEARTERNLPMLRNQVIEYLGAHMQEVADDMAKQGQVVIPTTYGPFRLTVEDLELAVA